jgi:hypothetical protein
VLCGARRLREPVIVLGRMPVYPKAIHNVWNDETVIAVPERHSNMVATSTAAPTNGNNGLRNGIH